MGPSATAAPQPTLPAPPHTLSMTPDGTEAAATAHIPSAKVTGGMPSSLTVSAQAASEATPSEEEVPAPLPEWAPRVQQLGKTLKAPGWGGIEIHVIPPLQDQQSPVEVVTHVVPGTKTLQVVIGARLEAALADLRAAAEKKAASYPRDARGAQNRLREYPQVVHEALVKVTAGSVAETTVAAAPPEGQQPPVGGWLSITQLQELVPKALTEDARAIASLRSRGKAPLSTVSPMPARMTVRHRSGWLTSSDAEMNPPIE